MIPDGPWKQEPNRVEFESHGFKCIIYRHDSLGHLCGYVGVPPGHPWYDHSGEGLGADVHGGLTYASRAGTRIGAEAGNDDRYYLGFDCAHLGDLSPAMLKYRRAGDVYRDIAYVTRECERLAEQAEAAVDAASAERGRS